MPIKQRVAVALLSLSFGGGVGILGHEAFRSQPYQDAVGVWTDGFGNTKDVNPNKPVTVERALVQALEHSKDFEGAIKRCVTVPLHQHEFDAYVSLTYNIGQTAFCKSTLVRKLNAGDYAGACAEISKWIRAGGRVLNGLVKRRAAERAMCEGRAE